MPIVLILAESPLLMPNDGLPGCLVLVVGPSGVGKDSLLFGAHNALGQDSKFHFPKRYITRPTHPGGEPHIALSDRTMSHHIDMGDMALHWKAHNCRYAIKQEDLYPLTLGRHVIINVSRTIVEEARSRFPRVSIVQITAPQDVLADRLRQRGRESEDAIQKRIQRAMAYKIAGDDVLSIDNSGDLRDSIARFISILKSLNS